MTDPARHARAREQSISFMVEATRAGDYIEALQWLNTLAAVDLRFAATADAILSAWRERAQRFRSGTVGDHDERAPADASDYRGLFAALLEQSYDGIIVSAVSDGWMLECSRSWEEITGYPRTELLGRSSVELGLIDPVVRETAVAALREHRVTGLHRTPLRRKDGSIRQIEFSTQLLAGDELMLTIARDVTDRD